MLSCKSFSRDQSHNGNFTTLLQSDMDNEQG